ncbi:hypothetical protein [Sphingomonas sp. KR3-1]|uniref:hypothetical protein n=1 Tax=Sphingomonas sp. KR3-1 TaxID=3156611 RepID=UPI0032B50E41
MPPSRYRVVEQGRRLVVVDSWSGEPVQRVAAPPPEMPGEQRRKMEAPPAPPPRPSPRPQPGPAPAPAGYPGDEGVSFVTARWYDNEGPRRIRLNQDGQGQLAAVLLVILAALVVLVLVIGWPIALPLAFVLFNTKVRDGLRTAVTTGLTAVDTGKG